MFANVRSVEDATTGPGRPQPLDVCQKLADEHKAATGHSHGEERAFSSGAVLSIGCLECRWCVIVDRNA